MKPIRRMFRWLPTLALASCTNLRDESATLRAMQAPACFTAIARGDDLPVIRAMGHADWEKTLPVSTEMHFRIGSVTKLFIGNLILILRDEGKLDTEAPISRYVSGVPGGNAITLRQLANHTSGLPDAIRSPDFQKAIVADPGRVWTADEVLASAFSLKPLFPSGTSWGYSNTNTVLLAAAAEKATGKSCADLLEEHIFSPLGMKNTGFPRGGMLPSPHPRSYRHGRPGHPIGYGKVRHDVTGYNASWANAAGDLSSTIGDLQRAVRPLCLGTLLSEESRAILHDWRETDTRGRRYGFCIESWDGVIGHRGDVPGYQALMAVDPASGRSYAIAANLSNTSGGDGPAELMLEYLRRADPP